MTDALDGRKYKTIKIGNQIWMAENLNYKIGKSWCYENNEANCNKYGRLYDWNTAQKACPTGWHLPSDKEFDMLVSTVGGGRTAGKKMKNSRGWSSGGNGTNQFGFSMLPSGYRDSDKTFFDLGEFAYLWSANKLDGDLASTWYFDAGDDYIRQDNVDRKFGLSVRCLKD